MVVRFMLSEHEFGRVGAIPKRGSAVQTRNRDKRQSREYPSRARINEKLSLVNGRLVCKTAGTNIALSSRGARGLRGAKKQRPHHVATVRTSVSVEDACPMASG